MDIVNIAQGIKALGKESFRTLRYGTEIQGDGLSDMSWYVEFVLNGERVWTEPCPTAENALDVAYKAKKELSK